MDPRSAYELRERVQFVDVRQTYEWEAGHLEGALHITLQELPRRFEELDRSTPVVAVCQIGQRSALATEFLRAQGFDAHNLDGGVTLWAEQGLPLRAGWGDDGEVVNGWAEDLNP